MSSLSSGLISRRNYKTECFAILTHIKSQKEFNAQTWAFDVYAPVRTSYVKMIATDATDGENFDLFGETRRTWKELADFLRAYSRGFWHGVKTGLEAETQKRVCIEIKTRPNSSGNVSRLYLMFDTQGTRREVLTNLYNSTQTVHDILQVTPAEFNEYRAIANAQKERK